MLRFRCGCRTPTITARLARWRCAAELRAGFAKLSKAQRQPLILVGASGLSYDEAALIAGCQVGTMKSRVRRGRTMLAAFLSGEASVVADAASEGASVRRAA